MTINNEQRLEIRRRLPYGSMSQIAEACGVSRNAVSLWFRGRGNSLRIEKAVIQALKCITEQEQMIQKQIKELFG